MDKWRERIVDIMLMLAVVMAAVIIVASADCLIFGGPAYRPEKVQFTRTTIENTGNNITSVKMQTPTRLCRLDKASQLRCELGGGTKPARFYPI